MMRIQHDATSLAVVSQDYQTHSYQVYVILGNAAILKCEIPSFVADFVHVSGWVDEISGANFILNENIGTTFFSLETCFCCYYLLNYRVI